MRIILLILLSVAVASWSGEATKTASPFKWMYQGTYRAGDVLADLCDRTGCQLGISGDVVDLPVTLSVKTSSRSVLLSSLRNALLFSGYYLEGSLTGTLSVYRDGTQEMSAFIDRFGEVQTVPKSYLSFYQKADSIKSYRDSLSKILPETYPSRWRLDFYSISALAVETYGLDLTHPLLYGDLSFSHPKQNLNIASSWNFDYLSSLDTLFETRSVSFDLDSSLNFSWGTQKQIADKLVISDGIQQTSYVWRQYGVDIQISSYPKMKMNYTLRSPDESTISGTSSLGEDSTIFVVARYDLNQEKESCFLPFFPFFCKPTHSIERRFFILVLYRLPADRPKEKDLPRQDP